MKLCVRLNLSRSILVVGVALAWSFLPNPAVASTRTETLEAIHHIENPSNSSRPGRYGELGAYQFRRSTWRMHTNVPFEKALDRSISETVAIRHYEWLSRGLARNGWAQTPYNIALAWNGGLAAVINGRASASTRDYAERVSNLTTELKKARLVSVR